MGSLVSREVGSVGGLVSVPWMVPGGTSYFVANEAFVVSDMFSALGGGEIDSVHVHSHRVFRSLFGSCVSGSIAVSTP